MTDMEKYNNLKRQIIEYYQKDEVESTDQIVSMYDLVQALKDDREEAYRKIVLENNLETILNKKRNLKQKYIYNSEYSVDYFNGYDDECHEIIVHLCDKLECYHFHYRRVKESKQIYIGYTELLSIAKKILSDNYDIINQKFDAIDKYNYIFNRVISFRTEDELYSVKVILHSSGLETEIDTSNKELSEIFDRTYYTLKRLSDMKVEEKNEILKRIPVKVEKLPEEFKVCVNKHQKSSKQKIKTI